VGYGWGLFPSFNEYATRRFRTELNAEVLYADRLLK
jgi:hypothetical protein